MGQGFKSESYFCLHLFMSNQLITSSALFNKLNTKNVIILDASPSHDDNQKIVGARLFDIKNDFSAESDFPNTFPSQKQFERECQKLGINNDFEIVVYDNKGIFSAPRVWWMFKVFGHENISVLDGGLPDWIKQDYETEKITEQVYEKGKFKAKLKQNQVKSIDDIKQNIISEECLVVDARSEDRFNGAPESRKGLRSGNIPKSVNLPYQDLLTEGKFKPKEELRDYFTEIEAKNKPLIFTCGSGITACVLLFAYNLAFEKSGTIYDGSWTEWGTLVQ